MKITNEQESDAWRPEIVGWSSDILVYYSRIAEWLPEPGAAVEVGVAHGRSLVYLAERLGELGKRICLYGVDRSPMPEALAEYDDLAWETSDHTSRVRYLRCASVEAAKLFGDNSLDFVFVDADHSAAGVRADIEAWLPRLRSGGILAGHDYSTDWPGVPKAVDEAFGGRHTMEGRTVWQYRVPEQGDHERA